MNKILTTAKLTGIGLTAAALSQFNKNIGRRFLTNSLGQIPGLPAKFSQTLSGDAPAVNPEPLPKTLILEIIQDFSPDFFSKITELSDEAHAASLGQLHIAKLRDNSRVAVKVQYPGVEHEVNTQLNILIQGLNLSPAKKFGLDTVSYRNFLHEKINDELDYRIEASSQTAFYETLKAYPWVTVPKPYPEYSTKNVLVQSYEDSDFIESTHDWSTSQKIVLANNLWRLLMLFIFKLNRMHTDPHVDNFGYRLVPDPQIVLYDFGSTMELDPRQVTALKEFILAISQRRDVSALDYLAFLGFDPLKLAPIEPLLAKVVEIIFEPLLHDRPLKIDQWNLSDRLDKILGAEKWWFRTAGPTWFLYFMRSAFGILNIIEKLNVPVNFFEIYHEVTDSLNFPQITVPKQNISSDKRILISDLAQNLRVTVMENKIEKVSLKLPVRLVDELETLLDSEVIERISARGINISEIKTRVLRTGYTCQSLFEYVDGEKMYKVWID